MAQKKNQTAEQTVAPNDVAATEQVAEPKDTTAAEQGTESNDATATEQVVEPNVEGLHVVRIGFIDKMTKKDYNAGDIIEGMSDARIKEINKKIPGALEPAAIINASE